MAVLLEYTGPDNKLVEVSAGTPLPVTITSDIQIGAVELKDATTDDRASISAAGALKVDGSAVTQPVSGSFFQATQPVSAATLPLPTGASTAARQDTGNTSLASIDAKLTNPLPVSGTVTTATSFSTRSDTYTATGSGVTVNISTAPLKSFSIAVKGTGGVATAWDVRLEGSLDNVNFTQILAHTNVTGDGVILFPGAVLSPCLYYRSRCSGLTLGPASNIVVTIVGL